MRTALTVLATVFAAAVCGCGAEDPEVSATAQPPADGVDSGARERMPNDDRDRPRGVQCGGGRTLCGDTCEDLNENNNHCGACGQACREGSWCSFGLCVMP